MKKLKVSIIMLVAVLLLPGVLLASPARIASITDHIDGPGRVAVDTQGNLYVTEAEHNLVNIYDSRGQYVRSFSVPYPLGIAVDAAGKIYVGSGAVGKQGHYRNAVYIYNADLSAAGSLGSGAGEFGYPNDIAIDGDGKIYVADTEGHVVKVFDTATGGSFTIGGYGSTDGLFKRPSGVAVNDAAGEVYVIDHPVVSTSNGPTDGARVQVFNKNGGFLRSFGQFGTADGQMQNPVDIAIDSTGLLYITDSYKSGVHILNPADGSLAGAGFWMDDQLSMATPIGITISSNGLVYVASWGGNRVGVYALDGYVTMDVTPAALQFEARQFGGNPPAQTIVIANTGSGTLNWSAAADQAWITLGTANPVGPASSGGLSVSVDISSFSAGAHTGAVTVESGYGRKVTVPVTVNVIPPSLLTISSGWLDFTAKAGGSAPSQTITLSIDNVVAAGMPWSIASDSPAWLSVAPASGTILSAAVPASVTVSVNAADLSVGSYTGLLTVSAPGTVGDGSKITVNLAVNAASKISVSTNLADASFKVSGPATYTGSGANWSVSGAPAGNYTVTYDAVAGYARPRSETKTLADGGELSFNASYLSWKELAARKNIVAAKGPGVKNDALVKLYKNDGTPVAFDLVALETRYGANVAVGDIDGDGTAELIVGAGDGPNNPATVRIFRTDKSMVLEFVPFSSLHGVQVASADLNGDGRAEVIVAPAGGDAGVVKVYTYDPANNRMVATGAEFTAHTTTFGTSIAVADLEGDGLPEIVTASGYHRNGPAAVRIWKLDTTAGVGAWTASMTKEIALGGDGGAAVAASDTDGDGRDEIIAGTAGRAATVAILKADGTQVGGFSVAGMNTVNLAAADLDGDGRAEIIVAPGPDSGEQASAAAKNRKKHDEASGEAASNDAAVRVYSAAGKLTYAVTPFEDAKDGIAVSVGDLGL